MGLSIDQQVSKKLPAYSGQRASVSILGSTGSIGQSTLAVLAAHPERYDLYALSANTRVDLLLEQCLTWQPTFAVINDSTQADWLAMELKKAGLSTELLVGEVGLDAIASDQQVDIVMAAIVGAAGLQSTLAAVTAGKKVLLANKESLVMAGPLFMAAVKSSNAVLLPIDSEHNAIFQCLPQSSLSDSSKNTAFTEIQKILLTGSGGPFRTLPLREFSQVTPEQACCHPNWSMGRKISVDSATMMNKGLELIEACYLFDCQPSLIEILLHPQSIIHSMVEYVDGSVLAQLGQPDMRIPIAHALAWPQRMSSGVQSLDWQALNALSFESPDLQRFPSLALARQVANDAISSSIIFNAANEVAVQSFLDNRLIFTDIITVVEESLSKIPSSEPSSLIDIKTVDEEARRIAGSIIACL